MLCYYLAVRCLLEAREFTEALQVLTDVEQEGTLFANTCSSFDSSISMGSDDVTPNVSRYELNAFFYGVNCTQFVSHCFTLNLVKWIQKLRFR
jgi:hypothetical protein